MFDAIPAAPPPSLASRLTPKNSLIAAALIALVAGIAHAAIVFSLTSAKRPVPADALPALMFASTVFIESFILGAAVAGAGWLLARLRGINAARTVFSIALPLATLLAGLFLASGPYRGRTALAGNASFAHPSAPVRYREQDWKFSIEFPGEPTAKNFPATATRPETHSVSHLLLNPPRVFEVLYSPRPAALATQMDFDAALLTLQGPLENLTARSKSCAPEPIGTVCSAEMYAAGAPPSADMIGRLRLVLSQGGVFAMFVVGPPKSLSSPETANFFASLRPAAPQTASQSSQAYEVSPAGHEYSVIFPGPADATNARIKDWIIENYRHMDGQGRIFRASFMTFTGQPPATARLEGVWTSNLASMKVTEQSCSPTKIGVFCRAFAADNTGQRFDFRYVSGKTSAVLLAVPHAPTTLAVPEVDAFMESVRLQSESSAQ